MPASILSDNSVAFPSWQQPALRARVQHLAVGAQLPSFICSCHHLSPRKPEAAGSTPVARGWQPGNRANAGDHSHQSHLNYHSPWLCRVAVRDIICNSCLQQIQKWGTLQLCLLLNGMRVQQYAGLVLLKRKQFWGETLWEHFRNLFHWTMPPCYKGAAWGDWLSVRCTTRTAPALTSCSIWSEQIWRGGGHRNETACHLQRISYFTCYHFDTGLTRQILSEILYDRAVR